jgi:hypothetical protein
MGFVGVGAELVVQPRVAFGGKEFWRYEVSLWGMETDGRVIGGVDGRVGGGEHGGERARGFGVPVGVEFLEKDLSMAGKFGGLWRRGGARVGRDASPLPGDPLGRW